VNEKIETEIKTEDIINPVGDVELLESIVDQDQKLSTLQNTERESFIAQNSHYILSNQLVELEYYGAKHIFEPKNPQFNKIGKSFQSFAEGKNSAKVVVFVEGSVPITSSDIEQDIHHNGERGFITHLARETGVEVASLEPNRVSEIKYLLEQFKPKEIEYYYYLRAIRDYFRPGRIETDTSFEEYSKQLLKQHSDMYKGIVEFSDFDFSLEHMKRIHEDITNRSFDQNIRIDIDPRKSDNVINKISKTCSIFRDLYHIRSIEKYLSKGFSAFVVNGEEHAVVQRMALEIMLGG
jgi:hypothetical protein